MFMLLSEQATGNPHGLYGQPSSRGHHVGDLRFMFRHSCHVFVSCYKRRANKFSKVKAPCQTYSHRFKTAWFQCP